MNKTTEKRNILLFIAGNGISQLGSVIYSFAIGLYVLNATGSGMKFAITLVIAFLPTLLLTPFAGVFADRWDRKKIVISMDTLNGLLFLLLFVYLTFQPINLTVIYLSTLITNILTTFLGIAFESAKPQLVTDEKLQGINSVSQIIMAGTGIIGPILGGLIYAIIDIKLFILVNGISFLCSAISEYFIDFNFNKEQKDEDKESFKGIFVSMKEGYVYLMKKRAIMKFFSLFIALNFAISIAIQVPLPYILNNLLKLSPTSYGLVNGLFPVGLILGAVFVGVFTKKYDANKLLMSLSFISSLIIILVGLPLFLGFLTETAWRGTFYYSIIMVSFGFIVSLVDVPIMTLIQSAIDEAYRGRVLGILIPMIKITNPVGFLIAGYLITVISPYLVPLGFGILLFVFLFLKRHMLEDKKVEDTEHVDELGA